MKIHEAELVISAVREEQYPKDNIPEIALAGRSNVGKSSFINRMIQRKQLVRTSSQPGKTQTLNFYKLNNAFYFVDVPGYGYAKVSKKERQKWAHMMENYFQSRNRLNLVVLVIDIRHEPTALDLQMYDYLKYFDLPVLIIATKFDKLPKNKRQQAISRVKKSMNIDQTDNIIPFSAITGEGKEQAWQVIKQYLT